MLSVLLALSLFFALPVPAAYATDGTETDAADSFVTTEESDPVPPEDINVPDPTDTQASPIPVEDAVTTEVSEGLPSESLPSESADITTAELSVPDADLLCGMELSHAVTIHVHGGQRILTGEDLLLEAHTVFEGATYPFDVHTLFDVTVHDPDENGITAVTLVSKIVTGTGTGNAESGTPVRPHLAENDVYMPDGMADPLLREYFRFYGTHAFYLDISVAGDVPVAAPESRISLPVQSVLGDTYQKDGAQYTGWVYLRYIQDRDNGNTYLTPVEHALNGTDDLPQDEWDRISAPDDVMLAESVTLDTYFEEKGRIAQAGIYTIDQVSYRFDAQGFLDKYPDPGGRSGIAEENTNAADIQEADAAAVAPAADAEGETTDEAVIMDETAGENEQELVPEETVVEENSGALEAMDAMEAGLTNQPSEELPRVATPVIMPESGSVVSIESEISFTCDTENAQIFYTLDGSDPDPENVITNPAVQTGTHAYSEPFPIGNRTEVKYDVVTVKFVAYKDGINASEIVTARFFPDSGAAHKGIWIDGVKDMVYTGTAITQPALGVYDGATKLTEGIDYTVSYANNVNADWYTQGIDPGADDKEKEAAEQTYRHAYASYENQVVAGAAWNKNVTDATGKTVLFNPSKMPRVTITLKGKYKGTRYAFFRIRRADLNEAEFSVDALAAIYNRKEQTPVPVLRRGQTVLKHNTDYFVAEYQKDIKADSKNRWVEEHSDGSTFLVGALNGLGDVTFHLNIVGKGNYEGIRTEAFTIYGTTAGEGETKKTRVHMSAIQVNAIPNQVFPGEAASRHKFVLQTRINPRELKAGELYATDVKGNPFLFTVKYKNAEYVEGIHFEIDYDGSNARSGTATVTLRGLCRETYTDSESEYVRPFSFIGEKKVTFKITTRPISKAVLSVTDAGGNVIKNGVPAQTYTGKAFIAEESEYETLSGNTGTYTLLRRTGVTGITDKTGTTEDPDGLCLRLRYGSEPDPLKEGRDYTIQYINNTAPGTATIRYIAKEGSAFSGEKRISFKINPYTFVASDQTVDVKYNKKSLYSAGAAGTVHVNPIPEKTYTGNGLTFSATELELYDIANGKKEPLTYGEDYTIAYAKNVNACSIDTDGYQTYLTDYYLKGKAWNTPIKQNGKVVFNPAALPRAVITFRGNYRGTQYVFFRINPLDISTDSFSADELVSLYNKREQNPAPVLRRNHNALRYNTDYYVAEYQKAAPAGAQASVKDITKNVAGEEWIRAWIAGETPAGYELFPEWAAGTTRESCKYLTGAQNGDRTYLLTIAGKGNYTGTKRIPFTIYGTQGSQQEGGLKSTRVHLNNVPVSAIPNQVYDFANPCEIILQTKKSPKEPAEGKCYVTNKGQSFIFTVRYKNVEYEEGTDFEIAGYLNNDRVGTATVILRGLKNDIGKAGPYSFIGEKRVTFKITNVSSISKADLQVTYSLGDAKPMTSIPNQTFNGKCFIPESADTGDDEDTQIVTGVGGIPLNVKLIYAGRELKAGTHYTVETVNNRNVGTATIRYHAISGAGFSGVKIVKFIIQNATTYTPSYPDLPKGALNVMDFGAIPNDGKDDTEAIKDLVYSLGDSAKGFGNYDSIYLPGGEYLIRAEKNSYDKCGIHIEGLYLKSDRINILMESDTVLQALPTNQDEYAVIQLSNVDHVTIRGGIIKGDRNIHNGASGESGMGIRANHATNLVIENTTILDCWGDGINLFPSAVLDGGGNPYWAPCENVQIMNCNIFNNRRDNISIINANHVRIDRCNIYDANGTPNQVGILIEPDVRQDNTYELCNDIVVSNTYIGSYKSIKATSRGDRNHLAFASYLVMGEKAGLINNTNNPTRLSSQNVKIENCVINGDMANYSTENMVICDTTINGTLEYLDGVATTSFEGNVKYRKYKRF